MSREPDAPAAPEAHLASAYQLESAGDLEAALAECRQALAATPDSAEAYNLLGIIVEQSGQPVEALEAFRTAIELDPNFEVAQENFAEAQAEARAAQRTLYDKGIWRSTLLGALVFGLAVLLVAGPMSVSNNLLVSDGLFSLAIGAAAVVMEIANRRSARLISFFLAGVVGVISGQLAAHFVTSVYGSLVSIPQWPSWVVYVRNLLGQAALGACLGAALGAVLPGRSFLRTLVAGAVGFATGDIVGQLTAVPILSAFSVSSPNVFELHNIIMLRFMLLGVMGVVGGASLGWAFGMPQASPGKSEAAGVVTSE